MNPTTDHLVWIDLEMTGLNPDTDYILEIATLITDAQLNIIAIGPDLVIYQPPEILDNMNEWCVRTHGATGLTARVQQSQISLSQATEHTLQFIQAWTTRSASPLCGNSIGTDKQFLQKQMPSITDWLHYRTIDVSSIKELAKRWYPDIFTQFVKKGTHRALDDIQESIAELQFYRTHLFKD